MTYKMTCKIALAAATLLASASIASAQATRVSPIENNQGFERDVHGAPHGSINNPSPHAKSVKRFYNSEYFAMEHGSNVAGAWRGYTGGGSPGYERLINTY
ncbi:MAG: hypothetical protein HYX37_05750 [Rhizobiales bacterium]|nr:hypothetical protein [Hyphomicrobiales bacterium]